jgi:hypothetical protein
LAVSWRAGLVLGVFGGLALDLGVAMMVTSAIR